MNSLVKKLWNMFKPLKHINRITLVNYAAMIIIIILVTLFWKNREGFYDNDGMNAMDVFLDSIIERNRQDIILITNSSLNSENAQQIYSIWKNRTTTSIQNYIDSYIDYYGNAHVSGVNSHMYNRAVPDAGIKIAARLHAINTFTSNLPSSPWPYGLAVGSAGYKDYITSTTYRDDIGGVAGATTGTSPAETGAVTGTFGGIVATGSITRNDSGGFVGCTFTISSAGINGNFIGGGGQCTFAGGIVIGGTLTGGTLTGNTLTGGTITSTSTSTSTGGTFTGGSITGVNCSLTGGTLTGILTGITTITGVTVTGNAIAGGNITGTFSGTFARAPSNVSEFMFRVPQTNAAERTTFNSKLTNIETEINILLTRWFQNHPNDDFTFANIVNDTATSSSTPSTSSSYSPSSASTGIVSGQGTSTSNANQSALIGQLYNTELLVGNVNTGMSPVAEYWKNKYYEQITLTGTNIARNSSMPYGPTGNEAAFWKKKYEEQINGARSGSILPYNSSTSYNLLNDGSTNASKPNASNPTTSNPTASNPTASNTTASNAESANHDSCSAATDDMYMLKSKMVYMNPTQGKTDSNTSKTDSNTSKTDSNASKTNSTKSNQNNYADSRDTKQAPYPPCPACDRCPEPAFDCKKVPNYKSVAINQYLPQPVLSSFAQFGM